MHNERCTSGSEGGPENPGGRKADRALRPDPTVGGAIGCCSRLHRPASSGQRLRAAGIPSPERPPAPGQALALAGVRAAEGAGGCGGAQGRRAGGRRCAAIRGSPEQETERQMEPVALRARSI